MKKVYKGNNVSSYQVQSLEGKKAGKSETKRSEVKAYEYMALNVKIFNFIH